MRIAELKARGAKILDVTSVPYEKVAKNEKPSGAGLKRLQYGSTCIWVDCTGTGTGTGTGTHDFQGVTNGFRDQ